MTQADESRAAEAASLLTCLVGNPRAASRTLAAATSVAQALRNHLDRALPQVTLDLAGLDFFVRGPADAAVVAALSTVQSSRVLLVATPTYKGAYTGLLKSFLDLVPTGGLSGVIGIPMMVAAAPIHALAVDVHLRPVLLELGATCPTPGLFVLEQQLSDIGEIGDAWARKQASILARFL